MNVDAATDVHGTSTGLSLVVRDEFGVLLAARNFCIPGNFTPRIAEAIAVKEALSWLHDKEWSRIIIESDCLQLINALNDDGPDFTSFDIVIAEIKHMESLL